MKSPNTHSRLSRFVSRFLRDFSESMNGLFVKRIADNVFAIGEQVVLNLNRLLPLYVRYYTDIIQGEIQLAHIHDDDRILHIGCGPVPSTSILLGEMTKGVVVGIDHNARAVEGAKRSLQQMNLSQRVQVRCVDAVDVALEDFSVIIVSQGVEPRDVILRKIANLMGDRARVIVRAVSTVDGGLTAEDSKVLDAFQVKTWIAHPKHGLLISVLLKKK